MAVVSMKRLELYGLRQERKAVLDTLQRRGVVEVQSTEGTGELFSRIDTSPTQQDLEQKVALLEQAAALLDRYSPRKKGLLASLEGRAVVSWQEYERCGENAPKLLDKAAQLVALEKEISSREGERLRLKAQLESLKPWMNLDIPLQPTRTDSTRVFLGTFPLSVSRETLLEQLHQKLPEGACVETEVLSQQPQQTCVFVLCHRSDAAPVEEALRSLGLSDPVFTCPLSPPQEAARLEQELQQLEEKREQARKKLLSQAGEQEALLLAADYYNAQKEKYRVLGQLWQSPHVFCLTGYLPAGDAPSLLGELESRFTLWGEAVDPGPEEDPPVKLKNGFFAAPMEGVVEGYSLPGKFEVDPCGVMAFFYYVLFGMMLSDAAYGILTVIGCGAALAKFPNMEEKMRKSLRMFLFCGISTAVWGVLFGSYFGDCIPVIARTFFHREISIPALWFEPLDDPMALLLFSFVVGVAHLFVGLGVQFYQLARRKLYADAVYDVVFWYLLVGGLIIVLLSTDMFVTMVDLPFQVPGAVGAGAGVLAAIGAVGILFTAGRESKNPLKRLLKGLYGLYGISSYLSDILSYSRLLALGLATGVISTVFNQMGAMLGDSVVGVVFFVVVFVIGHAMNIAINLLGAYVHTNRLNYVEFFGKFYEGGGRPYTPFAAHTRHFQIKEEK